MKTIETDVVVIGAGITGLTTAFNLIQSGKRVLLLEKSDRVGGQLKTVSDKGYVFETGPNTGVLNNMDAIELFEHLDNRIQAQTARKESKIRLIWKGKSFHALPSGLLSAVTTPLFSPLDKLRICFEPWRSKGTNPMESIGSLTRRRLGKTFFTHAIDPFISGVYAGDPDRLVTQFAMPKLYKLEQNYGSFIRGALKLQAIPKTDADKKVTKEVFSTPGGFGQLAVALSETLGAENIRLSCGSIQLEPLDENRGWQASLPELGERILAKSVVSTVPAYALSELLPFVEKGLLSDITNMPYAAVVQVGVGIREGAERIPMAFGGLVPSCEKKDVLGILFPSSCFPNRAPEGCATLAFFMGGRKRPEIANWSDEKIRATVCNALVEMLGFPSNYQPEALQLFRHKQAIPQYEADSEARIQAIERIQQAYPGLILAGGIRDGIGLGDRIKQAAQIAKNLAPQIANPSCQTTSTWIFP